MSGARNQQIDALYRAALARPLAERAAFVANSAAGDAALRESVERLLSSRDTTGVGASTPSSTHPEDELPLGTVVASFRIDAVVGRGGMGVVYRATDTKLNRPVALKFLSGQLGDAHARRRFRQEAETASALNHPHIVTVHDVGEHDGRQYIVGEFVDGGTLSDWAAAAPRTWRQCSELVTGVADALAAAHAAGVLHRDVKPGNILIGANGYAKLADFGLAKLLDNAAPSPDAAKTRNTGVGVVIGTVAYMSPEQATGQPLDARSDIFAFGVVLYELLAGKRPFEGATDLETLKIIVHAAPAPLPESVPDAVRQIVEKALEKDPAERYQHMQDLVVDLRRATRKSMSASRSVAPVPAPPLPRRFGRPVVAGLVAVALALLVSAALYLRQPVVVAPPTSTGARLPAAPQNGSAAASPAPARERLEHSVAVLPLANLSPNASDAFFAAGIHSEILNYLAKLKSVTVIGSTSMARYANTDKSVQEIGAELNVETVMAGSVRYADSRVRVNTQLIDARSGKQLWSEGYERDFKDIFAIQADIAMNVANALNAAFSPEEQRQVERVPTTSTEAYALQLQLWDLAARGNQSPQILALADQAIARDPNFAAPYGFKAAVYANLLINTTYGSAGDRVQTEALLRSNAERAIALDSTDPGANGALANVDVFNWRWPDARQTYERYYRTTGRIAGYFPWFLCWGGQPARAIDVMQAAVLRDPNSWSAHWTHGIVLLYAAEGDRAVAAFRRGIELAPALSLQHSWLAFAEIARGDNDEARRELQVAETLLGSDRAIINLVDIAYGYGRIGDSANAARLFAEIKTLAEKQDIGTGGWAHAYLGIGNRDKALEQLRLGAQHARGHVLDPGFFTLMNIRMNATRDPVLEQREFAAVRAALQGD